VFDRNVGGRGVGFLGRFLSLGLGLGLLLGYGSTEDYLLPVSLLVFVGLIVRYELDCLGCLVEIRTPVLVFSGLCSKSSSYAGTGSVGFGLILILVYFFLGGNW